MIKHRLSLTRNVRNFGRQEHRRSIARSRELTFAKNLWLVHANDARSVHIPRMAHYDNQNVQTLDFPEGAGIRPWSASNLPADQGWIHAVCILVWLGASLTAQRFRACKFAPLLWWAKPCRLPVTQQITHGPSGNFTLPLQSRFVHAMP